MTGQGLDRTHSVTPPPMTFRHSRTLPRHSRVGRPLNNPFKGMRMEPGARKMNGGTKCRVSQSNHSA